jgi:hypothetical protein
MNARRLHHTATLLLDGRVLMAGGIDQETSGSAVLASAELYDPATGRFSPTGSMAEPRLNHTATRLPDGRVLIAGGIGSGDTPDEIKAAELYDPATGKFSETGPLPDASGAYYAAALLDGRVLVVGFQGSGSNRRPFAAVYDPTAGRFDATSALPEVLWDTRPGLTTLLDGQVLWAGGEDATGTPHSSAYLYDPKTGQWSGTGSMTQARSGHTATLLADGRVLFIGGALVADGATSAEIYDPKTGKSGKSGSLGPRRLMGGWTATLLIDGRVLIAGDSDSTSAELYDPKTGRFSATESMKWPHRFPTATLLLDGRVLIAGGSEMSLAELYQP